MSDHLSGSCQLVSFETYGVDDLVERVSVWLKENPYADVWDIVWDINNNEVSYARIYYNVELDFSYRKTK